MQEPEHRKAESRAAPPEREYEQSGMYPEDGKPYRLWTLLGWLTLLIVGLAGASALLNFMLLNAS